MEGNGRKQEWRGYGIIAAWQWGRPSREPCTVSFPSPRSKKCRKGGGGCHLMELGQDVCISEAKQDFPYTRASSSSRLIKGHFG